MNRRFQFHSSSGRHSRFSLLALLAVCLGVILPSVTVYAATQQIRITAANLSLFVYLGGTNRLACYGLDGSLGKLSRRPIRIGTRFNPFATELTLAVLSQKAGTIEARLSDVNLSASRRRRLERELAKYRVKYAELIGQSELCRNFHLALFPPPTTTTTTTTSTTTTTAVTTTTASTATTVSTTTSTVPLGAPGTPTNLAATAASDTDVVLTWERAGSNETALKVFRRTEGGEALELVTLPAGSNIYTDTSCYPATTYTYTIAALNSAGSSAESAPASAATTASYATFATASNLTATALTPNTARIRWEDTTSETESWYLERSADGVHYTIVGVYEGGNAATVVHTEEELTPGATYYFRVRPNSWFGYGDFTPPVSVTLPGREPGKPLEPRELQAEALSATNSLISWQDTNNGQASYVIERASFSWVREGEVWTQVAVTSPGASSYNFTTTAETFYNLRIKARNGVGDSGYTKKIPLRTPSPGTGSAKAYRIGPGQTYTTLAALNWSALGPGDTVYIHPNRDGLGNIVPYYERPLISVRGTATAPIEFIGVRDEATGALPIIDGTNSIAAAQWNTHYLPLSDYGVVLIGHRSGQAAIAGYLALRNLEIRNGFNGNASSPGTYTAYNGTTRSSLGSGIYIEEGDHITISNCVIHGNHNGIFGAGQGDQRHLEDLTISGNLIYGNGTVNQFLQHNTYLEGINTTYQFNHYGPLRAGATGTGLKDRGAGTVIRYNWLEDGGHVIDLVETQNYFYTVAALPSFRETFVYGNVIYNYDATTPIHYGGDQGLEKGYRNGVLHFYHNTYVTHADQSSMWRVNLFTLKSKLETLDARNNVIYFAPRNSGTMPEINVLPNTGIAYFGRNWIRSGWNIARPDQAYTGHAAGLNNLVNGTSPAFAAFGAQDFSPTASSPYLDAARELPADWPRADRQYTAPALGRPRSAVGAAMDLGAFEYGL